MMRHFTLGIYQFRRYPESEGYFPAFGAQLFDGVFRLTFKLVGYGK
jgi:hypothetical protein